MDQPESPTNLITISDGSSSVVFDPEPLKQQIRGALDLSSALARHLRRSLYEPDGLGYSLVRGLERNVGFWSPRADAYVDGPLRGIRMLTHVAGVGAPVCGRS